MLLVSSVGCLFNTSLKLSIDYLSLPGITKTLLESACNYIVSYYVIYQSVPIITQ